MAGRTACSKNGWLIVYASKDSQEGFRVGGVREVTVAQVSGGRIDVGFGMYGDRNGASLAG
ncbi:hypothetical protein [Mycobacterium sp. MUNTM1]